MPVSLCLLCWKTGWDKRKKPKMPVCLCLCTFIEIRKGTKNLDFVLCTVVYIGLGKTSVTIWTIGSLENWGNHWGKWTILRSFRTTWVTLHDCIGGVTWQHIVPGRFLQIDYTQFDRLNLCCQVQDNFELWSMQSAYRDIQYDTLYTLYDVHDVQVPR